MKKSKLTENGATSYIPVTSSSAVKYSSNERSLEAYHNYLMIFHLVSILL